MSASLSRGAPLAGQTVVVVGLGPLSGLAAAKALARRGARVLVNDARAADALRSETDALQVDEFADAYEFVFGDHPPALADRADLFVISPGVPYDLPMLAAARGRDIPTIGELELAFSLGRARVVAVTGTKGKSTTTTLIGAMLDAQFGAEHVAVGGNIGVPLTEITPNLGSDDWLVAEVSSFQLESIVTFRPNVAVALNISPDHIDRHRSMEAYVAAKKRVVENQTSDDLLVVNDDDPVAASFAKDVAARIARFSLERPVSFGAFIEGGSIVFAERGRTSRVCPTDAIAAPGRHNVANALAAATVACCVGVDFRHVESSLRAFHGLPHAYERVAEVDGVTYVDDSKATNLAAVKAAIETATGSAGDVVLIMGGVDKGNRYEELAPTLRSSVARVILLGPNVARLTQAVDGVTSHAHAADMDEAVRMAAESAADGDVVLMSPGHASFDLYTNWKERGHAFQRAVRALTPRGPS